MTLWEILKANKTGIAPDMFTMLAASKMNGGRDRLHELSGIPPLSFTAKGKPLTAWSITGNTVQNGTPTPENPVEVFGCGDRTGNLFDNSLLEQGGWKATAGTIPTKLLPNETNYTSRTRYKQIIPLLASTLSLYCPANIKINYVWIDANGISLGGSGFQKNGDTVTAPEQAVSMTFILGLDSDIECTPSDFSDINVVAGSIAPESYEPYGYKIPVVTRGKNLFDKTAVRYEVAIGGSNTAFVDYPGSAIFIIPAIKGIKNYTLKVKSDVDINIIRLAFYDKPIPVSGEYVNNMKQISNSKNPIVTSSNENNLPYIVVQVSGAFVDSYGLDTIQLEVGNIATPYEPYHEPITTTIYLDKPLYKIGDYADTLCYAEQKAERRIKELVLTGDENCYLYDFQGTKGIGVLNALDANYARSNGFCSHYPVSKVSALNSLWIGVNNKVLYFVGILDALGISTVEHFRIYLGNQYANGTPVTVWYVLATPETESVTLPKIPTLNGTTVIDVDTAVKPESMTIKYRR